MEIRWKLCCAVVATYVPTFNSGIPTAGEVEEKEELKNLLKWDKCSSPNVHILKKLEIANFSS